MQTFDSPFFQFIADNFYEARVRGLIPHSEYQQMLTELSISEAKQKEWEAERGFQYREFPAMSNTQETP